MAAPFENVSSPSILKEGLLIPKECWVNLRAGYEGDFVFNARLKQSHLGSGPVDTCTQITNSGTVTLNILNRLDLYGVFGSSFFSSKWRFSEGVSVRNAHLQTEHSFLWAIGGRAVLLEWKKWALGVGGRYSTLDNPISYLTIDGDGASVNGAKFLWREWQLNLGISYHIDLFTPYIAAHYQMAHVWVGPFPEAIANNGSLKNRFETICPVGIDLGCTISSGKYFMLNVEARLISEEAISVSGDFRF